MSTATISEPETKPGKGQDPSQLFDGRLAEAMPDVNATAINAGAAQPAVAGKGPAEKKTQPQGSHAAATDEKGRTFDPLIHESDENGRPVFKTGKRSKFLKCKTRFKAAGAESHVPPESGASDSGSQAVDAQPFPGMTPEQLQQQMVAGATAMAGCQLMLMRVALGEQVGQSPSEREQLVLAWTGVFAHYGVGAVHPLVGLAMVSGSIVVGAWHHEETRSRFQKIRDWMERALLGLWQKFRGRRRSDVQEAETTPGRNGSISA